MTSKNINIDTYPKKIHIKFKYKVNNSFHYITFQNFNFETIRPSNMIDNEKQKLKDFLKKQAQHNWENKPEDFDSLKTQLNVEDKNEYSFYIPLSSYYFTFDNLNNVVQNLITGQEERNLSLEEIFKENIDEYIIDERITHQLETYLNEKFDRIVALMISNGGDFFDKTKRDKIINDTDEKTDESKLLSSIYFPLVPSIGKVRTPTSLIFNSNLLQQLGIGLTANSHIISKSQLDYQYKLGFLLFCVDLPKYFQDGIPFDFNVFITRVKQGRELDEITKVAGNKMINNSKSIMEIINRSENREQSLVDLFNHINFRSESIFSFGTLKRIQLLLKNVEYLRNNYYGNVNIRNDQKITIKPIFKDYQNYLEEMEREDSQTSKRDFQKMKHEKVYLFEIFNKFTWLNEKILTLKQAFDKILGDEEKNLESLQKRFQEYKNDKNKFFLASKKQPVHVDNIKTYFEEIQKNYEKNKIYEGDYTSIVGIQRLRNNIKYNTDSERKSIVKQYGKYVISDESYIDSDIDKLYSKLKADTRQLRNVITYYNILEILKNFYFPEGCILYSRFYQEIYSENNTVRIKKSEQPIYVKIKSIKPIKLNSDEVREAFEGDILEPIYELEYEEIPVFSNVKFKINFIDLLNPSTKLNDAIEENFGNKKGEENQNKKKIIDLDRENQIYIDAKNSFFSKNKNITSDRIYINKGLRINKFITRFNLLQKNNFVFRQLNIKTTKETFMLSKAFKELINYKDLISDKDNVDEIIFKYYVNQFFFQKESYLFIGDKYAQIKDVKVRILNEMDYNELKNNKYNDNDNDNDNDREPVKYFIEQPSKTTRFAIDKVDTSYFVYLDISIIYKDSPRDFVSLKDQLNYKNNCIGKANTLDKLLYNALGVNYPKNYLENKLRKKPSTNESTRKKTIVKSIPSVRNQKEIKEFDEQDNKNVQVGGLNKLTRKIISKQKNKTIKNLLYYYSI